MAEASVDAPLDALAVRGTHAGPDRGKRQYGREFIDLAARGDNRLRCYLISLLRIVLYPLAFVLLVVCAGSLAIGAAAMRHQPLHGFPSIALVVLAFGSVIAIGAAVLRTVSRTHRRPALSVVSADLTLDWRRLAIGASVQATLMLWLLTLDHWVNGTAWRLASTTSLPVLGLAFLLIPLQAASEEILFRGYLTQALGRILRSRSTIVIAIGLLFGALHFNAYGPLTLPYLFLVSLIFSLVSLRDGRLELTIGAHTAMNWLAIGTTDVLGPGGMSIRLEWGSIAVLVVEGALFYGLTRLLVGQFASTRARSESI